MPGPMTPGLDLVTTLLINAAVHLLMLGLLGLLWRSAVRRGDGGFGWWVLNDALLFGASLLLMAMPVLPEVLVLGCYNAAYFAFMPLLEHGLRSWFGRSLVPAMRWRWGVFAAALAGWMLLWMAGRSHAERVVWFTAVSLLQSGLLGAYLWSQWRGATDGARQGLMLIGLGVVLGGVMNAWRLLQTWPFVGAAQPAPAQPLSLLVALDIVTAALRVAAMLLLLHGRVEFRLRRATAELERRANVDGLTQVSSRAHFEAASALLLARARSGGLPVCLLACDMDGFKAINDELGHPEGDALLEQFARHLRASQRDGDLAGRLGGDEFAALLFNCTLDEGRRIGEQLRELVAGELQACDGRRVTLSAGVALVRPGEDFDALYRRADGALYAAKAAGRNRVVAEA